MSSKKKCLLSDSEIIERYEEGYSTREIGLLANVSDRYIRLKLNDLGVTMRSRGSWKRKFDVNEDYFKTWSNNMAYVLGFFLADGFIASGQQTVSFSQKEKEILERIRVEINSTHPIIKNEKTGVFVLNIHSKVMKEDLIKKFNVTSKKSQELIFPDVPDQYLNHFIRGYFDGDGFVNYTSFFVSFVGGSFSFMKALRVCLEENGFETNFTDHESHYRVYVSGRKTIKRFSDWMYKDKDLFLQRKFNAFQKETLPLTELKDRVKVHRNAVLKRREGKNNF